MKFSKNFTFSGLKISEECEVFLKNVIFFDLLEIFISKVGEITSETYKKVKRKPKRAKISACGGPKSQQKHENNGSNFEYQKIPRSPITNKITL